MKVEPLVNRQLIDRIRKVRDEKLVEDDSYEVWKDGMKTVEEMNLTKLSKQCEALTSSEIAAFAIVAIKNYPEIVLKAILDELTEGERNGN